jgi:hypothetical protein
MNAIKGLANTPSDCAEQLADLSYQMAHVARGMAWVARYAEDVDPQMRESLWSHGLELEGAAKQSADWANAIVAA